MSEIKATFSSELINSWQTSCDVDRPRSFKLPHKRTFL